MPITLTLICCAAARSLIARCGSFTIRHTSVCSSVRHACGKLTRIGLCAFDAPFGAGGISLVVKTSWIGGATSRSERFLSGAAASRARCADSAFTARATCSLLRPAEPASAAAAPGAAFVFLAGAAELPAGSAGAAASAFRFFFGLSACTAGGAAAAAGSLAASTSLRSFFFFGGAAAASAAGGALSADFGRFGLALLAAAGFALGIGCGPGSTGTTRQLRTSSHVSPPRGGVKRRCGCERCAARV